MFEKQPNADLRMRRIALPMTLAIWLFGLAYGFWYYELRYYLPAVKPAGAATLSGTAFPFAPMSSIQTSSGVVELINSGHPILLNFWNPECPCSKFMEGHVKSLLAEYRGKGVEFVTVVVAPQDGLSKAQCAADWLDRGFSQAQMSCVIDTDDSISRKFGVWAAPAAVIIDGAGRVEYIGAYNVARYCDNSATAYAQFALGDVLSGKTPRVRTLPFYGCQITPEAVTPHVL